MYFQLQPIFCSASYLLHNLFRKASLNTSLQVKSWNRHRFVKEVPQGRDKTPNTGLNHKVHSQISTLTCALLLQGQLGAVYPLPCVTTQLSVL